MKALIKLFRKCSSFPLTKKLKSLPASRDTALNWDAAKGADGYNVRYGIAPDKMYNSWQVWNTSELDLSMVNAGYTGVCRLDLFGNLEPSVRIGSLSVLHFFGLKPCKNAIFIRKLFRN